MITGYGGFFGEQDNQGYYVGADAMDLQYPVSFSSWSMVWSYDDGVMVQCFYVVDFFFAYLVNSGCAFDACIDTWNLVICLVLRQGRKWGKNQMMVYVHLLAFPSTFHGPPRIIFLRRVE